MDPALWHFEGQHHNPAFDVDERALTHSVDLLEALVRDG